jgi:subtilisin
MTKRKVVGSALLSLAMGVSLFATGAFGQTAAKQDNYRVYIQGSDAQKVKQNYNIRWDFGNKGFTATVNDSQFQALLKNKNLKIEKVPEITVGEVYAAKGKPGGGTSAVPSDPTPWGIQAIYSDSTITKTSGGSGVVVAVLDTGVLKTHKDLAGSVVQCKDFSQTKTSLVDGSCADGNGHGTHVSGTILANGGSDGKGIFGVAPEAKLWSYKVLNDRGSGYSDDIASAIRTVADQATSTGTHVVISMSLGSSSKDSLISDAVDYAYGKGVLVVAAAGNDGSGDNTIGYPGGLVNVVAVAALENVQENGTYRVADFSSRGNSATDGDYVIQERDVEVSAPGRAVESTWNDGAYNTISGTSMATPHVSGLAAKIWAANPSWSQVQVRSELQNRAKAKDILGGISAAKGDDNASGFGFPTVK